MHHITRVYPKMAVSSLEDLHKSSASYISGNLLASGGLEVTALNLMRVTGSRVSGSSIGHLLRQTSVFPRFLHAAYSPLLVGLSPRCGQ
jgi:hypothetical protein